MRRYYVERTGQAVFTLVAVVSISFVLIRKLPGGPQDYIKAQLVSQNPSEYSGTDLSQITQAYTNIDSTLPLHEQYIDYMAAVLSGDLGKSIIEQRPVAEILGEALPWTVFLMTTAMFLLFFIGVALGAVMAYREGSWFDSAASTVSIFLNSVPFYVAGIMLVYVLAYQYQLFPTRGRVGYGASPGEPVSFLISVLEHATLPILSFVLTGFGGMALTMRGNSIQVLGEDYLRVARLRGLSERRIALRYVARNAILPMYTGLMIQIGFLFGGSVVLEEIFSYTGVGYYLFQALEARDYPLMMGAFIVITIAVVIGVFIADVTYGLIDPTVESGGVSSYE